MPAGFITEFDKVCPYYHLVPKGYKANLAFRREMIEWGQSSKENMRTLWIMCARDILFYWNVFYWTYDPRKTPTILPFITWKCQDKAILKLRYAIHAGRDVHGDKSRDMGFSWVVIGLFLHEWMFREGWNKGTFLLVSRKEDLVDKRDDPDSLMWKLDFLLENQPRWLIPRFNRKELSLVNLNTGSTIDGASTTGDVSRGGRRTAIGFDEFSSVENADEVLFASRDASPCRIFFGTPKGDTNAFANLRRKPNILRIRLLWFLHPEKAAGLYRDEKGKLRSPWYNDQEERAVHPAEMAQEVDGDYLGSSYQFFDKDSLERQYKKHCKPPNRVGRLDYDITTGDSPRFVECENGPLRLWCDVDADGRPVGLGRCAIGVDVSAGSGASNSCASAGDLGKNQKIAEFITSGMMPHEFAVAVKAFALWLRKIDPNAQYDSPMAGGAWVGWEINGPGVIFGNTIIGLGYPYLYFRPINDGSIIKRRSDTPGWASSKGTKLAILGDLRKAYMTEDFKNPSKDAVDEAQHFIYFANGTVAHSRSVGGLDPSANKENHGDSVIADALLLLLMNEYRYSAPAEEKKPPKMSYEQRRRDRQRRAGVGAGW